MEKNVWLQYSPGEINEKIRYWADRWQELIDNFNINSYGLRLSSPHLLVRAISEEIEYNSLRNAETRALFKDELSRVLKQDSVVRDAHVVEFVALIKNFETATLLYLDTVCAAVLPFFGSGDYFRGSLSRLIAILKTDVWSLQDAQEIGRLSNVLIVEFLLNRYHVKTIRTFPQVLFSQISILPNDHPMTEFPHKVRDTAAASEQAAEIAEEFFDWMQPHWTPKNPVEIDRRNYIVIDSERWIINTVSGVSRHNASSVSFDALDVDSFFQYLPPGLVDAVVRRIGESRADQPLANKLPVCLRWYRKAVEAVKLEDKLLYYWVVLERAFAFSRHDQDKKWSLTGGAEAGRFRVIVEYVPVHEALTFMYDFGWQLHHYLYRLLSSRYMSLATHQVVPYVTLSPELMKACVFDGSSRTVTLDDFLPNLDKIAAELADLIVKEKVEEVVKFYRDPVVAKTSICKKFETTRDEIVLIYRLRNSIVHQGHFDRKLVEPFAARVGELARNVIRLLFTKFVDDPDASVETLFAAAKVQYDRTIARLEQNLPVDFVSPKQWGVYPRMTPREEEPVSGSAPTAP